MTEALTAAQEYAARGWRVAPIPEGLKHPGRGDWQDLATTDESLIARWWTHKSAWSYTNPDPTRYGVCVATGRESGVFVLDIDTYAGGDETLADLEHAHGALPDTVEAVTASGGRHLYFRYPASDVDISNADNMFGEGIDVRGNGGQVVAPPTQHPTIACKRCSHGEPCSLGEYMWEASSDPADVDVADAPDWLLDMLTAPPEVKPRRFQNGTGNGTVLSTSDRPGDRYELETEWADLLTGDGWTPHSHRSGRNGDYELWTRPGKLPKAGASASLYFMGSDVLKVFTPSVPGLDAGATYTRFGYLAATRHGGDHTAAARSLMPSTPTPSAGTPPATPMPAPAAPDEWAATAPQALDDTTGRPPFPTGVFPAWIRAQIEQTADELQMTDDLPSMLAITALSVAAAGRCRIVVQEPWREPLNTYAVTALPPGAGKSPAFKAMLAPYDDWETELIEEAFGEQKRVNLKREMIEQDLVKAKRNGETAQALQLLDDLEAHPPVVTPRLIVEDITPESLAVKLGEQGGRLALTSTEGGLFQMMTGRYSDKGANLDVYLQAWSADTFRRDRVKGDSDVVIRSPTLTIGITVQPQVIAKLAETPELQGRGLVARFMFSIPPDGVGTRNLGRASTWNTGVASEYSRRLIGFAHQARRDWQDNDETVVDVHLSAEARALFLAWRQGHEARLGLDGDLRYMAEWVTKLQSTTARLSALLHLAGGLGPRAPIPVEAMASAIEVGDYWEAHARLAHDLWGSDPVKVQAKTMLDWVRRQGVGRVSASEFQQGLRRTFKRIADVVDPIVLLVELGWLRPAFEGPFVVGQRGQESPVFVVHPDTFLQDVTESGGNTTSGGRADHLRPQPKLSTVSEINAASDQPTTESRTVQYHQYHQSRDVLEPLSLSTGRPPAPSTRTNGTDGTELPTGPPPHPQSPSDHSERTADEILIGTF